MNKERMVELADYIEAHTTVYNFDMALWSTFTLDYTDSDEPRCQTTACLAGWAWIKENQQYLNVAIDESQLHYANDSKFWERRQDLRFTPIRPVHHWAIENNIEYDHIRSSPERIFAQEWLELTDYEATELFTCTHLNYPQYSLWDLNQEELQIAPDCDCPASEYCDGHLIEATDVHRDAAIMMLRKLGSGEWSFDDVR
jgi:hypothetical protein